MLESRGSMKARQQPLIFGIWRFDSSVSRGVLLSFAAMLRAKNPRYVQLYVRQCGRDAYGLGFAYLMGRGPAATEYRRYFDTTQRALRDVFGAKLVGWDVSGPAWVVKYTLPSRLASLGA